MSTSRIAPRVPTYQPTPAPRPEPTTNTAQSPGAARRNDVSTFESTRPPPPVNLDGGAPTGQAGIGAAGEAQGTAAIREVNGIDSSVLETQEKLSVARQKLGELQLSGSADPAAVHALQSEVTSLEAKEKAQFDDPNLKDDVEKAQFVVLEKRMGELEQKYGKQQAATLARQTYYNSDLWNLAGGSQKASDAQVLSLGLPHTPGAKNENVAVGGYEGQMRTPDGQPVDMGHVLCGLDWQLNKDRVPKDLAVDDLAKAVGQEKVGDILEKIPGGGSRIPNPFTLGFVTLTGDLGSAVQARYDGKSGDEAIAGQGDYDWNGDVDGLNLAHRLETHPNQSISDAMKSYYDKGEYKNRVDEFATHGAYFKRDGNGQPLKDKDGHYEMDTDAMARDGLIAGVILSKGSIVGDGVWDKLNPFTDKPKDVAEAYEAWVHRAQDAS